MKADSSVKSEPLLQDPYEKVFSTGDFVEYLTVLNASWVAEFGRVFAARKDLRQEANNPNVPDISAADAMATMNAVTRSILEQSGIVTGERAHALGKELIRKGEAILRGDVPIIPSTHIDTPTGKVVGGVPR